MIFNNIIFSCLAGNENLFPPIPAKNMIPDWYKNTKNVFNFDKKVDISNKSKFTIKKCLPVFDSITSGYLFLSQVDIYVSQKVDENGIKTPWYEWARSPSETVQTHNVEQISLYPNLNKNPIAIFSFPWSIETPKGYSCLFIAPPHRSNIFSILPAIVDTDQYVMPCNFPFVLNDLDFEGLIPAGTPIAQIIPFKRESWNMKIGNKDHIDKYLKTKKMLDSLFFNKYKRLFWNKKEFN